MKLLSKFVTITILSLSFTSITVAQDFEPLIPITTTDFSYMNDLLEDQLCADGLLSPQHCFDRCFDKPLEEAIQCIEDYIDSLE